MQIYLFKQDRSSLVIFGRTFLRVDDDDTAFFFDFLVSVSYLLICITAIQGRLAYLHVTGEGPEAQVM